MSGKLDQSLEEILSTKRRSSNGPRRNARRAGRPAATAPIGGIAKNTKPTRENAAKPAIAKGAKQTGESKVIVSNMPVDVSEGQIKEYFQKAVGQVKRVELSYGPGGKSRGIASVIFQHGDGAKKAFSKLNGLLIDNRPIKVEVVVSGDLVPSPPTLSDRVSQPKGKAQPKSAAGKAGAGAKTAGAKNGAAGAGAGAKKPRRAKNARPVKKTAEELDSEMADYYANGSTETAAAAPATAAPAAATNGDSMEDEVL